MCVLQTSSQRPVYPQTRPPPIPAMQGAKAAPAAAQPTQVCKILLRNIKFSNL